MRMPWTMPPTRPCSAISTMRASMITACTRGSSEGRQVLRRDRRARRQARDLRGEIHLRPRSLAAISRRVSRWAHSGAVHCLGFAAQGAGRPALVPPLSERADQATTTFCIGPSSIRTGTSCAPSAIRPACARTTTPRPTASRPLVGDQRRLRGLSRAGLGAMSPGPRRSGAGGRTGRTSPTRG